MEKQAEISMIRKHRVGTITLGIGMIGIGSLFLGHMIFPLISYAWVYKVWPVILIILGIEILLANSNKQKEFIYDKTAIVLIALLVLFAIFLAIIGYGIESGMTYENGIYIDW